MTSSKFARIHNRLLKQRKYQKRNSFPDPSSLLNKFLQFIQTDRNYSYCYCDRGIELAKDFLKHNHNIKQVARKVIYALSEEDYYLRHLRFYI